jgi:type VI secretion system protein ImpG
MEVVFFLNRTQANLEQGVETGTFRLGCTPVVNLFEQVAEPIDLTRARYEYKVIPDVAYQEGMEVFSVDAVTSTDPTAGVTTEYQPFYSIRHAQHRDTQKAFWYAARRPSTRAGDRGTDVFLNLVDLNFHPKLPGEATLIVRTTCTNRALPRGLQQIGDQVTFELEAPAPLARILCPRTPSAPLQPPLRHGSHWRLLAHLNLNHLSLTDPDEGKPALQEILALYDFADGEGGQQTVTRNLIDGIVRLSHRRVVGRVGDALTGGIARGVEITLELDEEKYLGTGMLLFASVLERFFALYASVNSFTQLVATDGPNARFYKKWPPRAGEVPLI